jgi:hypothetical protein
MRRARLLVLFLALLGIAASLLLPPETPAKEELTDTQLDAGASGISIEGLEDAAELAVEHQLRRMVINNVFGDSEVVTDIFIDFGSSADELIQQNIVIVQEREPSSAEEKTDAVDERSLRIDSQKNLSKLVVNNVAGSNIVETVINIYAPGISQEGAAAVLGVPLAQGHNAGGGLTGSGAQASGGGITVLNGPESVATSLPTSGAQGLSSSSSGSQLTQNIDPVFFNPPTTLSGATSLLENIAPLNPTAINPRVEELRRVNDFISTLPRSP